jgi:hypothetical protein
MCYATIFWTVLFAGLIGGAVLLMVTPRGNAILEGWGFVGFFASLVHTRPFG